MYYMFFSTSDVFIGESILQESGLNYKIVPTPIKERVYCGVCIFSEENETNIIKLFKNLNFEKYK